MTISAFVRSEKRVAKELKRNHTLAWAQPFLSVILGAGRQACAQPCPFAAIQSTMGESWMGAGPGPLGPPRQEEEPLGIRTLHRGPLKGKARGPQG